MHTLRFTLIAGVLAVVFGCSGPSETTTPDPTLSEPTEPAPPPAAEAPEPKPPEEAESTPRPRTPEQPAEKKTHVPYTAKAIIAVDVERETLSCEAHIAANDEQANRRACVTDLAQQLEEPGVILVTDETVGRPCPTCVTMTAEASKIAANDSDTEVLFMEAQAGTVQCHSGTREQTMEESRAECFEVLAKQASSIRADVIFPLSIDEGEACNSCVSIVGTGYTATVLAD